MLFRLVMTKPCRIVSVLTGRIVDFPASVLIFSLIDGWDFEKLPSYYNTSPFLSLDHEVVLLKEPMQINKNESYTIEMASDNSNDIAYSSNKTTSPITTDIPGRQGIPDDGVRSVKRRQST